MHDAIVIGGGPAGAVCASLVMRAGPQRRVLVLEKDRFPRHHVGESLIAGIAPILARAGLLEKLETLAESPSGVLRKAGIAYWWGERAGEGWTTDFRDPETGRPVLGTYQVDRAAFDQLLLEHARELGAEVIEGAAVRAVTREPEGWRVAWGERSAHAPLVIDASGLARIMARTTGTAVEALDDMSNYALYGYWEGSEAYTEGLPVGERERWTFISTTELGWVWHIPLERTRASVGLVTTRDALRSVDDLAGFYRDQVRKARRTWSLLEEATLASEVRVVRDWSAAVSRPCGEGWLAIGDAAGFVDPILTSGMLLAISGASLAAAFAETLWSSSRDEQPLLRESYAETYRDLLERYHRLAHIWYRRNDKVRSWWWEARSQASRASLVEDDRGAFLSASLGLARDPHAAAVEQRLAFEPVRPDKELFAHHLYREADDTERTLGEQLTRLTAFEAGERDARGAVHARLMERWRALLDAEVALVPLESVERERWYCDRTMPRWKKARFVELARSGAFLDRVVLGEGPLLELLADDGTLRARVRRACPHDPGSTEARDWVRAIWRQIVQLDMRDWLVASCAHTAWDPSRLQSRALELAPTLRALEVGLLGRSLTLHLDDAPVVDLVFEPTARAWKHVGRVAVSYRGPLRTVETLESIVARVRDDDAALLRGGEGHCAELRDGAFAPIAPDQL